MLCVKKRLLLLYGYRKRTLRQLSDQFPETVLRVAVEETGFPAFDRGKGTEDQDPAVFVPEGTEGMCQRHIFTHKVSVSGWPVHPCESACSVWNRRFRNKM